MHSVQRALARGLLAGVALDIVSTTTNADARPDQISTRTLTLDAASTALPLVTGGEGYSLLGCYKQPAPDIPGASLGRDDEYILLIPVPLDKFGVVSCLQGCATATPSGQYEINYKYVAIEDGKRCFCGNRLSEHAERVGAGFCDSPCAGNPGISCGGHGYVAVYSTEEASLSGIDAGTEPPATGPDGEAGGLESAAQGDTLIDGSSSGARRRTGAVVGAALGTFSGILFLAALIFFLFKLRKRRKTKKEGKKTHHERVESVTLHPHKPHPDAKQKPIEWEHFDSIALDGKFSPTTTTRRSSASSASGRSAESPRRRNAPANDTVAKSSPSEATVGTSILFPSPAHSPTSASTEPHLDDHRRRYSAPYPPAGSYAEKRRSSLQGDYHGVRLGRADSPPRLMIRKAKGQAEADPSVLSAPAMPREDHDEIRFFIPVWLESERQGPNDDGTSPKPPV